MGGPLPPNEKFCLFRVNSIIDKDSDVINTIFFNPLKKRNKQLKTINESY